MSLPLPSSQEQETNLLQWSFSGCGCTWQLPGVNSCNCACRAFLERAFMFFGPVNKDWLNQQPVCLHASKVTWALTNYKTIFFNTLIHFNATFSSQLNFHVRVKGYCLEGNLLSWPRKTTKLTS